MKYIFTIWLVFVCQISIAKVYYVSPNGSDKTGNGSVHNPWQTLFMATANVTTAGDIIHVLEGVYTETLQCVLAVGVSIEGEGQTTTIIRSTLASDWTAILVANSEKEGTAGNQSISNIKFDGQNLTTSWGIHISGRSNVSIFNCTIVDFKDRGVTFTGKVDNKNTVPLLYSTGNSFHDNIIINCAQYIPGNYGTGCLNIGGQEGMLIYNNVISQNSRKGGYNGWPIKYVNDGYLRGCKIYNNKLTKIPMGSDAGISGWDFAIELFNVSGLEIFGNTIQGAIDLNILTKAEYDYSVWIHDNFIGQPILNTYMETGITLEFSVESAIIENNRMSNLGIPVFFTPREGSLIQDVVIKNNICENIGVADGSHMGGGIRMGEDNNKTYYLNNLSIRNNKFTGKVDAKTYWGIAILGIAKANNVDITGNTIDNFSAGCITANPALAIDSMLVENNNISNNGFANRAAFYIGLPKNYRFNNNVLKRASVFSLINIKMNVVRPIYYVIKSGEMLILITFLTFVIGIWFLIKEHVYVFPVFIIYALLEVLLNLDKEIKSASVFSILLLVASIYGWVKWSKRDRRHHRILRVSKAIKSERFMQFVVFAILFITFILAIRFFENSYYSGLLFYADAFVAASAFTGIWLMLKKKLECWYWWIITCLVSIPLFFLKHYVVSSMLFIMLLLFTVWGLFAWGKLLRRKKRVSTS